MWWGRQQRERSNADSDFSEPLAIAGTVADAVPCASASAKRAELHDDRHRCTIDGQRRMWPLLGLDRVRVRLRLDGESRLALGGRRARLWRGQRRGDPDA